jgi:HK97 family phage major capsid protein
MRLSTNNSRGRDLTRILKTRAAVGSGEGAEAFAISRWGSNDGNRINKAAFSALSTGDVGSEASEAFLGVVVEGSVVGSLVGLQQRQFNVRMLARKNSSRGYWTGESNPIPLNKPMLEGSILPPLKVAAIIVSTKEAVTAMGQVVEDGLQSDLQTGSIGTIDAAFLDPANAGIENVAPASVTHGAPTVASSGDAVSDLKGLIALFRGNMKAAYFVTDPDTAAALAMVRTPSGSFLFPEAGPRGGSILGIPLITSTESPRDTSGGQIALIDPTGIAYALDGIELDLAKDATLVMSDTPTSPAEQVSLFQTNCVAWRLIIRANWENQRAGGVVVLTGADY